MMMAQRCLWQLLTRVSFGLAVMASPAAPSPPSATVAASSATELWLATRVGRGIGPPGGEIRDLVMAPGDPSRLYAGTANGYILATDDGAASWRDSVMPVPADAVINRLAVDPRTPDIAYGAYWLTRGGGGLVRTRNGGRRWEMLQVPGMPALRTVALAPSAPDTVYVAGETGIWRSADGGGSWTSASGENPVREVESLAIDPRRAERVYVGTRRQVYRSDDAGVIWARIGQGMNLDRDVFALAASALDPDSLIAGTCGFVYVSSDGGDNWQVRKQGFGVDDRRVQAVVFAPSEVPEIWAGTRGGIYRSRDAATTFQLVHGEVAVSAIAVDPGRASIFAATEELGILVSREGAPFVEANVGLDASRAVAFDVMPGDLRVLFVARTERPGVQSLQASNDAGRTWSPLGDGLQFDNVRFLRAIASPIAQLLVIADDGQWWRLASGGWLESFTPPPGRVAAVSVAHGSSAILAATDRGLFVVAATGLASKADSGNPPSLWRGVFDGALTALDVRGDCYLAVGPGTSVRGSVAALLGGEPPEVRAVEPFHEDAAVVAVVLGDDRDGIAYAITNDAVFLSADRGSTWDEATLPWPAHDFRALAIDPSNPDQVVALDARGALFRGQSRGRHWRILDGDPRLARAQDLRLSSRAPGLVLVATLGHGVRVVSLEEFPQVAPTSTESDTDIY